MLELGLLWYNRAKHTHETTLKAAIKHHIARLGTRPNVVFVHPDYDGPETLLQMRVRPDKTIQKNHYYLTTDPDLPELEIEPELLPPTPRRPIQGVLLEEMK